MNLKRRVKIKLSAEQEVLLTQRAKQVGLTRSELVSTWVSNIIEMLEEACETEELA